MNTHHTIMKGPPECSLKRGCSMHKQWNRATIYVRKQFYISIPWAHFLFSSIHKLIPNRVMKWYHTTTVNWTKPTHHPWLNNETEEMNGTLWKDAVKSVATFFQVNIAFTVAKFGTKFTIKDNVPLNVMKINVLVCCTSVIYHKNTTRRKNYSPSGQV